MSKKNKKDKENEEYPHYYCLKCNMDYISTKQFPHNSTVSGGARPYRNIWLEAWIKKKKEQDQHRPKPEYQSLIQEKTSSLNSTRQAVLDPGIFVTRTVLKNCSNKNHHVEDI